MPAIAARFAIVQARPCPECNATGARDVDVADHERGCRGGACPCGTRKEWGACPDCNGEGAQVHCAEHAMEGDRWHAPPACTDDTDS